MSFIYVSRQLHELKDNIQAAVTLNSQDVYDRKAMLDIGCDIEAMANILRQMQRYIDGDISYEDYLAAYNLYRSKRGQFGYSD